MKSLKYAKYAKYALVFLLLFLCCFPAASPALGAQVYTLKATLVHAEGDGSAIVIQLHDGSRREVSVPVAKNCRFLDLTERKEKTFDAFTQRYMTQTIEVDFIEQGNDYLIVECRGRVIVIL